jgi:hypothetical protein
LAECENSTSLFLEGFRVNITIPSRYNGVISSKMYIP